MSPLNASSRIDRIRIALLCFLVLVTGMGVAQPAPLRVGVYDNPPKLFVAGNGHAAGILIDLLDKTAAAEGWTVQYVPCTWTACVAQLARGEIDLLPDVAYTEERARMFAFHDVPALLSWSQLYRGGRVKVASIVDLRDKRIAVLDGSVQAAYLQSLLGAYGLTPHFVVASSFDEIACNDDPVPGDLTEPAQATTLLSTQLGETYYIQVGGWLDEFGRLRLEFS